MSEIIYYRPGPKWEDGCVDKQIMKGHLEPIPAIKIPEVEGLNIVRDLNQQLEEKRELIRKMDEADKDWEHSYWTCLAELEETQGKLTAAERKGEDLIASGMAACGSLMEENDRLKSALNAIGAGVPRFEIVLTVKGREIWLHDFILESLKEVK